MFKWLGSIRSLVTLLVTGGFLYLTYMGKIGAEVYIPVLVLVLNYYFREKERPKINN